MQFEAKFVIFRVRQFPRVRQLQMRWAMKQMSMTYNLSNKCAKNYSDRTILVQVIVEDKVAVADVLLFYYIVRRVS